MVRLVQRVYASAYRDFSLTLTVGAGAMAPKPPWLTQNFAQWRAPR